MDCAVSSHAVTTHYFVLSGYIENILSMLSEIKFSLQLHPCAYKTLILKVNSLLLQLYATLVQLKLCKSKIVCFNLAL